MNYCILKHYIAIEVIGQNAPQYLQGQMTNNVLEDNQTLFCNIKGRIVAMMQVLYLQEKIFLIMNQACWSKTLSLLEKTAQLARVQFQERPDIPIYGLIHDDKTVISLQPIGDEIDYTTWHELLLKEKKFELYPETIGKFLPHDLGLEKQNWIDFKKGCYRGQEIIARMHYLGKSKYHLILMENQHSINCVPGMMLFNDATPLGELVDFNEHLLLVLVRQSPTHKV